MRVGRGEEVKLRPPGVVGSWREDVSRCVRGPVRWAGGPVGLERAGGAACLEGVSGCFRRAPTVSGRWGRPTLEVQSCLQAGLRFTADMRRGFTDISSTVVYRSESCHFRCSVLCRCDYQPTCHSRETARTVTLMSRREDPILFSLRLCTQGVSA